MVTTSGTKKTLTAMTTRMMSPHTARPVAVSAGLRRSTVSVKLAIHGAKARASDTAISDSRITNVLYAVVGWVALSAKIVVNTIARTAPRTMNGLRTRSRSEMTPTMISPAASNAQNQLPSVLALDWL